MTVGGLAEHRMNHSYAFLAIGGVAYEENLTGRHADLYDIIGAITSIILATVSVVKLIYGIIKDKQQESNRRSFTKE